MIPKVDNPNYAIQCRPISCCVIYKCISKVLCMGLRKSVATVVARNQAAFVENRSLIHNVLICHDLFRHYNRKTTPRWLVKIDLKKVYDMVSWEFIEESLLGDGFPQTFVHLIMTCVTTTKFSIKANGQGYGYFEGRTALRQGDHMSPLLFVVVMDYLSTTLKRMSGLPDFSYQSTTQCTRKPSLQTWYLPMTWWCFVKEAVILLRGWWRL